MSFNPFLKKTVVVNPRTRAPLVAKVGSGLNASNQPKQASQAVVNPLARSIVR
jgi:hypothetical protein